jgi:hypothetical protein
MYSRRTCGRDVITGLLRGPALHFLPSEDSHPEAPRVPDPRRSAVAGLVITLLLVLGGVVLVHVLNRTATLQDCVMSGRTNCAPIDPAPDGHTG